MQKVIGMVVRRVLALGVLAWAAGMSIPSVRAEPPAASPPASTPAKPEAPAPDAKPASPKPADAKAPEPKAPEPKPDLSVLTFTMKDIDGNEKNLADFTGKVVLIVNVASKCGHTPQYKALEKLYRDKKDAGLVVLAFPANNFGSQEPGSDADIKQFCASKYEVTFPMFSKVSVKGEDAAPLYRKLATIPEPMGGEPDWNFTKYVVNRKGDAVRRFPSRTKPDDAQLTKLIDELLAQK